jgi:1,4-dihydroxy-2-naphthoate octaprenyltransferase
MLSCIMIENFLEVLIIIRVIMLLIHMLRLLQVPILMVGLGEILCLMLLGNLHLGPKDYCN